MFAAYLVRHVREDMFNHVQTMSNQSLMMIWPFQPVPSTFSCSKTCVFPAQNQIIQIFDGFPSCRSSLCHPFHSFCFKSPKSPKSARESHFSPTFFCPFSEPPVTGPPEVRRFSRLHRGAARPVGRGRFAGPDP